MPTEHQTDIILESQGEFKSAYLSRKDKTGFKPKYSTNARDHLRPPELYVGMWIYNTDTQRPNRYDGAKWVELPE